MRPQAEATRAVFAARRAALLEDAAFMAEHGETMTGAAVRLGMTPTALYKVLHQYAPDTCALLQAAEKRVAA